MFVLPPLIPYVCWIRLSFVYCLRNKAIYYHKSYNLCFYTFLQDYFPCGYSHDFFNLMSYTCTMYIHLWEYCPQAQYRIIILQDLKKFSHSFGTTLVLLESPSDLFGTIFSNCEQTLLILSFSFQNFLIKSLPRPVFPFSLVFQP